uniref:Uncharacterized protein n=1 Tax=Clastoptera arizonana TaxID=38151 RepID=A0A1B6CB66_9HEMI
MSVILFSMISCALLVLSSSSIIERDRRGSANRIGMGHYCSKFGVITSEGECPYMSYFNEDCQREVCYKGPCGQCRHGNECAGNLYCSSCSRCVGHLDLTDEVGFVVFEGDKYDCECKTYKVDRS